MLDRYPPRTPASLPPAPHPVSVSGRTSVAPSSPTSTPPGEGTPSAAPGGAGPPSTRPTVPLITLERPFDPDEFSALLGGTSIRVTVPREALPEVLRRVLEFMGFGIYVYAISVRPAPTELLKGFLVELQRIDYSSEKGAWVPFVEKGTADSPFGPGTSSDPA